MLIIGAAIVLVVSIVGVNLIRGAGASDPASVTLPQPLINRPQPVLSEINARISEREELRRHFLLNRPGLAR